jgi:hypothetical protein
MKQRILAVIAITIGWVALAGILGLCAACTSASPQETPDDLQQAPTANAPAFHIVQLAVRDAETTLPVADAQVKVGNEQGNADVDGTYAVTIPHGTTHPVMVQIPGYKDWQGQIDATLPDVAPLTLDVALEPNTVEGQIVGYDAMPLSSAHVTLKTQPVNIDDAGHFMLRRVKEGDTLHPVTWRATSPTQDSSP